MGASVRLISSVAHSTVSGLLPTLRALDPGQLDSFSRELIPNVTVFQGCWIEQYNFHGFPGSREFPLFLRRLNGLGHCVGASLFPAEQFNEQALFTEITTAIAQMEPLMVFVNDLISFYKEFDDLRDQTSLVKNYCQVEGISLDQALEKLTRDTISCSEQMLNVFEGKDPKVVATLEAFIQGYVTWHLCDKRYRMNEIYERSGDNPLGVKFRNYYEEAKKVGNIDQGEWAVPPVSVMAAQAKRSSLSNLLRWFYLVG